MKIFTKDNDCKHDNHKDYSKKIDRIQMVLPQELNRLL